jgi:hypothetical protein
MPRLEKIPKELLPLLARKYKIALNCGCVVENDMPETFIELVALRDEIRKNHRCEKQKP